MASGQRGEALDRAVEVDEQGVDRRAQLEHQRGIDDVLAASAPMHEARGLLVVPANLDRQRIDYGKGDVARGAGSLQKRRDVVAVGLAGLADLDGRGCRDHADRGLGAGKRRLEVEHALQARPIAHDGAHGRAGVKRRQQLGGHECVCHWPHKQLAPLGGRANPRLRG